MDNNHDVSAHHWILALTIFVGFGFAAVAWELSELSSGLGILVIANHKLGGDVTALRQELAGQRETIEAMKASASKSNLSTPVPAAGDVAPKAKPHR
jgi:hypothetical protein